MHPETAGQLRWCRCPQLLQDGSEASRRTFWACLDRGHHDWIYDGSTCCSDSPRNWRQACHCGAQRWAGAPAVNTAENAARLRRVARLRSEMSTVPALAGGGGGSAVVDRSENIPAATELPGWMWPPRPEGWVADDLDDLPGAPRHTELVDGALVFRTFPQRSWHSRLVTALTLALTEQGPAGVEVEREMTVTLDRHNRCEPDVLATTAPYDPDRTWYAPEDVLLVVEVVSPESAHRDRTVKLRKYAEAGIRHYWRVEDEDERPVVHAYELDGPTRAYAPTGIHRHALRVDAPFPVVLDLDGLVPGRRS